MLSDATLLSPAELAELLGVHRASVYRRINSGELPAIRLGEDGPRAFRRNVAPLRAVNSATTGTQEGPQSAA
jgi:excisionase family DNA binding protein